MQKCQSETTLNLLLSYVKKMASPFLFLSSASDRLCLHHARPAPESASGLRGDCRKRDCPLLRAGIAAFSWHSQRRHGKRSSVARGKDRKTSTLERGRRLGESPHDQRYRRGILVVSQFTLAGDVSDGNRPDYTSAMPPADAEKLYNLFIQKMQSTGIPVAAGTFGAMMEVSLVNDGPVTLILER